MKYAVCNEMFVDWPFDKAFATAREFGYTGVEIAPFTIDPDAYKISPEKRKEVAQQAQAAGLEVIGLHWLLAHTEGYYLTSPDAEVRKKTADYVSELARLCSDLGGWVMVFGSPYQRNLLEGVSHADAMKYAADVLQQAMPVCEDLGVTIALEPLSPGEGDFLLHATDGIELAKMVDSANCKLHLDTKAMSSEGKPLPEIIHDSREWLVHFHTNDPNLLGPGMGDLDFEPILQALKEIEYDGWLSVEVFDYDPGAEKIARESIDHLKAIAEKIGC